MNKKWFKAAGVRALKTFCQTAASMITIGAILSEINWTVVASASAVAAIYSILTSFAGLPEVEV
ncbi:holin [Priestia megaterium]|uniref:holin n=1 Tax=Priestia megaterium TaxID=1404 RepID=UPI002E1D6AC4|nr:holin [Priestia megaterium]